MALEGVILDVDGTLVLSNDAHTQAWVAAFADHGYDISFDQVRPLIGMGGDQIIPRLVPQLSSEAGMGKQISERHQELMLNQFSSQLVAANGARQLVQKLQAVGLHLIVASSSTPEELEKLLKIAQVADLLEQTTSSGDAQASKPAPDIVEAALNKANLQGDQTLMLGDTPYDIEAAAKVGVDVIAFRSGGFSDQQLAGAIAIYNDPADLLSHYQQSPLAARAEVVP